MLGVPWHVVGAAALVVSALPLLAWSVGGVRRRPAAAVAGEGIGYDERQAYLEVGATSRVLIPVVRALARRVKRITPGGWVEALDRRIRLAGSPPVWTLERTLALKVALGLGGAIAAYLTARGSLTSTIGYTAGGLIVGYALPDVILRARGRERQGMILRELPDTLDQLTISVEAGLGFDAALSRVAASGTGPLAEELTRVLAEIKVGVPRSESLKRLLSRTDVYELRHFILALQQAEQFGLPVARVLRIQSTELRLKRRQRAEEAAMKIPVKIVFPLVFCIFPALFVVLLGPAMIRVARVLL
ncbi:MAG TPA: type II secretion system F family protein [Acidimicrobiia bacterium]|nr:type II secretion system F family protein [Acidimicrobiia bacterium]